MLSAAYSDRCDQLSRSAIFTAVGVFMRTCNGPFYLGLAQFFLLIAFMKTQSAGFTSGVSCGARKSDGSKFALDTSFICNIFLMC